MLGAKSSAASLSTVQKAFLEEHNNEEEVVIPANLGQTQRKQSATETKREGGTAMNVYVEESVKVLESLIIQADPLL